LGGRFGHMANVPQL